MLQLSAPRAKDRRATTAWQRRRQQQQPQDPAANTFFDQPNVDVVEPRNESTSTVDTSGSPGGSNMTVNNAPASEPFPVWLIPVGAAGLVLLAALLIPKRK